MAPVERDHTARDEAQETEILPATAAGADPGASSAHEADGAQETLIFAAPAPDSPMERVLGLDAALPLAAAVLVAGLVGWIWVSRAPYPFDLEWMEGGMMAHAWRIAHGLPLYPEPGPEFVPFIYPPGYSALVAVLGQIFGLTPMVGRAVSIVGTVAAALAAGFVVLRQADNRIAAVVTAAAFLGTYPAAGAFYDLVRPDGLMIGLLGWSIALGLERHPRAPALSGLLLAAAFLAKHNVAILGLPMLIGIWARDGRRGARDFLLASAAPALLVVLLLEVTSQGRFLLYLLRVPASHPWYFSRIWPGTLRELGNALPIAIATLTGAALWQGIDGQRALHRSITTFGPIGLGMAAAAVGTYLPPKEPGLYNVPSGIAFFAAGAIPAALAAKVLGTWLERRREGYLDDRPPLLGWRGLYGAGVLALALASAAAMRAHNGGFVNVHIPAFWALCVAFGLALAWMRRRWPGDRVRAAFVLTATAQLSWALARIDADALVPTDADRALGEELVVAARAAEGEVLSPFAAWIPVYAGKPPSLHYMGLWDIENEGNPFYAATDRVREAVRAQHWDLVMAGSQKFPYDLAERYELLEVVVEQKDPALMPKSGWRTRPNRLLVPIGKQ